MKHLFIPVALFVSLLAANGAAAQTKGKAKAATPAPAEKAPAAAPAVPGGPINMKEIEGKWKIERIDLDLKSADGEVMKNSLPGGEEDFFEFNKGTMTNYVTGQSESVVYTISGPYIISRQDGITDSLKVTALNKTSCNLYKKEDGPEGSGTINILLKR